MRWDRLVGDWPGVPYVNQFYRPSLADPAEEHVRLRQGGRVVQRGSVVARGRLFPPQPRAGATGCRPTNPCAARQLPGGLNGSVMLTVG